MFSSLVSVMHYEIPRKLISTSVVHTSRHDNARDGAELYNSHFAESKKIEDFDEYMFSLRPGTNTRNPWFRDYWHKLTGCGDRRAGERFCDQVDSKL